MTELQIDQRPANPLNYSERRGMKIDRVIIHTTQGSASSAVAWFKDPAAKASAHYVIAPAGTIFQCVDEGKNAWHAGNGVYNRRSIGIECAGHCEDKAMWTPALLASLCSLTADICRRMKITPDKQHILGHDTVPNPNNPKKLGGAHGHTDPGQFFPWEWFFQTVKGMVSE